MHSRPHLGRHRATWHERSDYSRSENDIQAANASIRHGSSDLSPLPGDAQQISPATHSAELKPHKHSPVQLSFSLVRSVPGYGSVNCAMACPTFEATHRLRQSNSLGWLVWGSVISSSMKMRQTERPHWIYLSRSRSCCSKRNSKVEGSISRSFHEKPVRCQLMFFLLTMAGLPGGYRSQKRASKSIRGRSSTETWPSHPPARFGLWVVDGLFRK
jgi:hypothetical protein